MQKTCLWNYAFFSWNTRHHHICTCEFCLRHDFWIYGFSKIWHYGIHFRKIRKNTFFLHEPNECAESTGHSNWRTFHTAHICKLLCLNGPLKEKNWYNIFIPILKFKISLLLLTLVSNGQGWRKVWKSGVAVFWSASPPLQASLNG